MPLGACSADPVWPSNWFQDYATQPSLVGGWVAA